MRRMDETIDLKIDTRLLLGLSNCRPKRRPVLQIIFRRIKICDIDAASREHPMAAMEDQLRISSE